MPVFNIPRPQSKPQTGYTQPQMPENRFNARANSFRAEMSRKPSYGRYTKPQKPPMQGTMPVGTAKPMQPNPMISQPPVQSKPDFNRFNRQWGGNFIGGNVGGGSLADLFSNYARQRTQPIFGQRI